ncbi:MAG: hypothetical protein IJB86_05125 [Clostridia bacterium]|nr:hypothetical protein [Clostridia bacterium]
MAIDFKKIKEQVSEKAEVILAQGLRKAYGAYGSFKVKTKPSPIIKASSFDYLPTAGEKFTVGFGKATVFPKDFMKKRYFVAGYGDNNPATGYLDEPHAHAVWIDDNTGRGAVVLVTIDTIGLLKSDVDGIRADLTDFCKTTGCRNISIMSTHNHASIDTMGTWGKLPFTSGRDKEYMKFFYAQVKQAVIDAYKDRRDGKLYLGSVEVPDMQEDIRTPIVYSKILTRVRFAPDDGSREVFLINFASHSESLQGCNSRVSADFPGYLREAILEKCGAETAYFVGALGGMISMDIPNEQEIRDAGGDFAESTRNIGRKLADYALSITEEKEVTPNINFMCQEFYFEADNTVLLTAKFAKLLQAEGHFREDASLGLTLKSELTYFEIGELHILMIPCELFPELAYGGYLTAEESATGFGAEVNPIPLVEIAGDPDLIIFGLSNDEVGYVLPPNDFLLHPEKPYFDRANDRHGRRHYEETNSLGPRTAQTIADVFTGIMAVVKKTKGE